MGGREYRITHPLCAEDLIDEEEFERDERIPYWAEVWTGAIALARDLCGRDLRGAGVVELGCGVGLPSVVAMERGARVLATDYYEAALDFTVYNAQENLGREPQTGLVDWREPQALEAGEYGLVIAAEVLYEARNIDPFVDTLKRTLAPGGYALVAESRRPYAADFLPGFKAAGFSHERREEIVERNGRAAEVLLYSFYAG